MQVSWLRSIKREASVEKNLLCFNLTVFYIATETYFFCFKMIVATFFAAKLRVNCFLNLMEKDFLITHGNLVSLSVPVCWQSSRQNVYFHPKKYLVLKWCFLPIHWNKKTFQLYNREWCWNSNFIFEKTTILKILGWYRVRVVLLVRGLAGAL